jgi:sigma-B regulation protein RsbU (phosphoserine phosphatase)
LARLLKLAWQIPLFSVPFTVFFGTVMGMRLGHYVVALKLSLVFSGVILVFIWGFESFVLPRLMRLGSGSLSVFAYCALYSAVSLTGALLAVFVIRAVVLPGFLGDIRAFVVWGMYMLLFLVLVNAVSIALSYHQGAIEHARRDKELELARRIQHSFLPESFPVDPKVEVHALNVPSRAVSGDFYDVVPANTALLLAVADVEGKSVPAALFTSMLQASLRTQAGSVASTAAILAAVNSLACGRNSSVQQFATFFLARLTEDGKLTYTNAGHNPPLLFSDSGKDAGRVRRLDVGGTVLGLFCDTQFDEEEIELRSGDTLVAFTDGVIEARSPLGEEFGEDRLVEILMENAGLPAAGIESRILRAVEDWTAEAEQEDDLTLLILKVT